MVRPLFFGIFQKHYGARVARIGSEGAGIGIVD
jgi:hypothetical protein